MAVEELIQVEHPLAEVGVESRLVATQRQHIQIVPERPKGWTYPSSERDTRRWRTWVGGGLSASATSRVLSAFIP